MVSLISVFNKYQVDTYVRKTLSDITDREILLWEPKQIYSCYIFKRHVITVSLENKKFKVRITGRANKRYVIFCYKTNGFNYDNFLKGTQRFLRLLYADKPKDAQIKKTFKYISAKYGVDITELNMDYLLVVEKLAVNSWFNKVPCLTGDFVAP